MYIPGIYVGNRLYTYFRKGVISMYPLSQVMVVLVAVLRCGSHNCCFCGVAGKFALNSAVPRISCIVPCIARC